MRGGLARPLFTAAGWAANRGFDRTWAALSVAGCRVRGYHRYTEPGYDASTCRDCHRVRDGSVT